MRTTSIPTTGGTTPDGNATLSVYGLTALNTLTNRGWEVFWTGRPAGTPVITNLSSAPASNSAVVTWITDIPSDSTVYYGTTTGYGSLGTNNSLTTNHSVTVTGLTTNTAYRFYVASATNGLTGISWDHQFTTLGAAAIYFVSTSMGVEMFASNNISAVAIWNWGDGASETVTQISGLIGHTFANSGPYTNYVTYSSANTLLSFGVECSGATTLTNVWGLNNFPNLQDIFFFQSHLAQISLTGCSNLVHIALAGCDPSTNELDGWFNDLAAAEPTNMPPGLSAYCDNSLHYFYYTTNANAQLTTNSATARGRLTNLAPVGWTLYEYSP